MKRMNTCILGINSAYHESAACILRDGILIVAAEEERFNRIKHAKKAKIDNPDELPINAINYCLEEARINMRDVDHIGFSFDPEERLKNIETDEDVIDGDWGSKSGEDLFYRKIKTIPQKLSLLAGIDIKNKFHWINHHLCHASSAFFVSPFEKATILTIDGIGEFTTTLLGVGEKNKIKILKELPYPNSIGFLWEKIDKFLGLTEYDSAKIMGLSAYGDSKKYYQKFKELVKIANDGEFLLDNNILKFRSEDLKPLEKLFGVQKLNSITDRTRDHEDIAAGLQKITDEVIISLLKYLSEKTGLPNLCMSGGVALNASSNYKVLSSGYFKNVFIQPASHDAGTALGAAYYIWHNMLNRKKEFVMRHTFWGPEYSDKTVEKLLKENDLKYKKITNIEKVTAGLLAKENIIGWFQGRLEYGPRALGHRSLLADPRDIKLKDLLNNRIKHREPFRPFAASILAEDTDSWFKMPKIQSISSEFMLVAFDSKKEKQKLIPAVIHVDGTSRIQIVTKKVNPKFHKLLTEFKKITGMPLILNTSFNVIGEPIICSPQDAVNMFGKTEMDYLVINNFLIFKNKINKEQLSRVKKILMCPPKYFKIEFKINPYMDPSDQKKQVDSKKAWEQWNNLYNTLKDMGIEIELLEPQKGVPDLVFPADCGEIINPKISPKTVLLANFKFPERKREEKYYEEYFRKKGYKISRMPKKINFEFAERETNDFYLHGYGIRNDKEGIEFLRRYSDKPVYGLKLVSPWFYHLAGSLATLNNETVMYYPKALDGEGVKLLKKLFKNRIVLTKNEALKFAGNCMVINNKILISYLSLRLKNKFESLNLDFTVLNMSEFEKAGGAINCLVFLLEKNWQNPVFSSR